MCFLSKNTENISIQYSEELVQQMKDDRLTEEEIEEREKSENELADESEGKNRTCRLNTVDLVDTLKSWKSNPPDIGSFSEEVWKNAGCQGTYFN